MADFQRRHYEALADVIKISDSGDKETLIMNLKRMLRHDNFRFDEDRFNSACEPNIILIPTKG